MNVPGAIGLHAPVVDVVAAVFLRFLGAGGRERHGIVPMCIVPSSGGLVSDSCSFECRAHPLVRLADDGKMSTVTAHEPVNFRVVDVLMTPN